VCVTVSVFVQVTVVPAVTFSSAGANARFPSVAAFVGIETAATVCPGAGAGDGAGAGAGAGDGAAGGTGLLLSQAANSAMLAVMSASRTKNM
jgi:hypothetical protein